MRIIKEGKLHEKEIFRLRCSNCQTEFEFEREEARLVDSGRNETSLTVECPLCQKLCYHHF